MRRSFCFLRIIFPGFLFFSVFTACTEITEFDGLVCGTLTVYSEDFAVVGQVQGIEQARKLLVYPGYVFVVKGDGYIDKYSSETLQLLGSYKIGQPSPAGYFQCTFSPRESSMYVVGSVGNIIEVSIPSCLVVDDFSVCASPSEISASSTSPAYLYVCDGASSTIWIVKASSNITMDSFKLPAGILSIEASESDTTLVGTDVGTYRVEFLVSGGLTAVHQLPVKLVSIKYFPWYGNFAAVSEGAIGIVEVVVDPGTLLPALTFNYQRLIQGTSHLLAGDNDRYAYVLSYMGENMGIIEKYDMAFHEISERVNISGIPLDMDVSGSGLIYVLTMEN